MTDTNKLTFEQPLNERTRLFLRVEHQLMSALHALKGKSWWDSRNFLVALDDLMGLLERCDIRTELYKALDRQREQFEQLKGAAGVDTAMIEKTIAELESARAGLEDSTGKIAHELRQNEFLSAIRARIGVPGGSCSFDIPAYHQWLSLPYELRSQHMEYWLKAFGPIIHAVSLVLNNTRRSVHKIRETASEGMFQQDLDPKQPCQLLQISLPQDMPLYPEISSNKHRLNIRLIENSLTNPGKKVHEDVPIELGFALI